MIVAEMYKRGVSIAEFKAWSQNLGHEGAMITLTSYGKLSLGEQGRIKRDYPSAISNGTSPPAVKDWLSSFSDDQP